MERAAVFILRKSSDLPELAMFECNEKNSAVKKAEDMLQRRKFVRVNPWKWNKRDYVAYILTHELIKDWAWISDGEQHPQADTAYLTDRPIAWAHIRI